MIATPEILEPSAESRLEAAAPNPVISPQRTPVNHASEEAADENLYLIGRPTLKQFLRFARTHAINPPDEGTLTDEWQAAYEVARVLEKEEAGLADNPPITPLEINEKTQPLLSEFLKDPQVQGSFNTVPTEVALVELDRLVVYQHHIDLTYIRLLERELGPSPSEEQVFRTSLLHDHPRPVVKWDRAQENRFVFMSSSNDIRFLGTMKLQRENITGQPLPGDVAGVVGLAVGFGSNFMNATYAENRLILNNGSHRAYALRKIGITHAPCIVQHVSSREKLDVVAASEVMGRREYYLKHPRPSLLKDYFDPRLHKVMPVRRQLRQISVKFEVEDMYVPAL